MKQFSVITLTILIFMIIGFFMFGSEERINQVQAKWRTLTGDQAQICLNLWADKLKDPASAVLLSTYVSEGELNVKYKAKNGFGAYTSGYVACPLEHGKVTKDGVLTKRIDILLGRDTD